MPENLNKYMYMFDGKKIDIQDAKTLKSAVLLVNNLVNKGVSLSDAVKNVTSSGHPHVVVNFTKFMKDKKNKALYMSIQDELVSAEMKNEKKQEKLKKLQEEREKVKGKIVTEKIGSVMQDAIDRKNGFYTSKERELVIKFNRDPNKRIVDQNYQRLRLDKATARLRNIIQQEENASNVTRKIIREDKDY